MSVNATGILVVSSIKINGEIDHQVTINATGSIDFSQFVVAGIFSVDEEIIIASISAKKGRWGDEIEMTVENLPEYYKVTLGGIEVEILSVDGNKIRWKVPSNVPVGQRLLEINASTAPLNNYFLLESNEGYILLENGSLLTQEN